MDTCLSVRRRTAIQATRFDLAVRRAGRVGNLTCQNRASKKLVKTVVLPQATWGRTVHGQAHHLQERQLDATLRALGFRPHAAFLATAMVFVAGLEALPRTALTLDVVANWL